MAIYDQWCDCAETVSGRKEYWLLTEKAGGRAAIKNQLRDTVRSHYDVPERIADDITRLGYSKAAAILKELLPRRASQRSGELGEILAAELVAERTDFEVPIKRLRYKDGRESALRGDDFIGVKHTPGTDVKLLKGEAKSYAQLGAQPISDARAVLKRDGGRCTPISLLFVASQLLNGDANQKATGQAIRNAVALRTIRVAHVDHFLFTVSGNKPPAALKADYDARSGRRKHHIVNLRIKDHQAFIASTYKDVADLGDD